MITKVKDIIELLEGHYPPYLAEKWDNVGLQIGNPNQTAHKILVTLDIDQEAAIYALEQKVDMIICHHPLIFHPLSSINFSQPIGILIKTLINAGIAVYAAHTNMDKGERGISQVLAEIIGLENIKPLDIGYQDVLYKLVVYVPGGHEIQVREAILTNGAGFIGDYSDCSFKVKGTGSFRPLPGTNPYIGQEGVLEEVEEYRLETIVPQDQLLQILNQLIKVHPYEEPAYDIYRLENQGKVYSLGRWGSLPNPVTAMELGLLIKTRLGVESLRITGDLDRIVKQIAVVSGAGASLLAKARQIGCDALVTGDLKYHEAREAEDMNMTVIDAGHQGTEQIICSFLPDLLEGEFRKRSWQAKILSFWNHPYIKNI